MSAEFFRKKWFAIIGGITAVSCVLGVYLYSRHLQNATVEAFSHDYYFLVSNSTSVEASTHTVQLNGGAGYLLDGTDREYVAISAYLTAEEAEKAQANVQEETKIFSLGIENLYFKSKEDKKNAPKIVSAFRCLEDIIEVLHKETARLEQGATQQSSKRILQTLQRQLCYLGEEYGKVFPKYQTTCTQASSKIDEIVDNTVYVKDLRYLQCFLCDAYVSLAKDFSL